MYRIGIDVGGTKIEGVLLDQRLKEIARLQIPTEQEHGYEAILAKILVACNRLSRVVGNRSYSIGIGTPGSISPIDGRLRFCNINCMNGRALTDDLADLLGRKPALANDANCFGMAETWLGAARGARVVFGMVLGTGCGGSIVVDGKVLQGANSIAGEWGHMTIDPAGPACYCGRKGCIERFLSGSAAEDAYAASTGATDRVALPVILSRASAGEVAAQAVIDNLVEAFGIATANIVTAMDPDVIVIGGGLSNIDALYSAGIAKVVENVMGGRLRTQILRNSLGATSGVLGAALIGQ